MGNADSDNSHLTKGGKETKHNAHTHDVMGVGPGKKSTSRAYSKERDRKKADICLVLFLHSHPARMTNDGRFPSMNQTSSLIQQEREKKKKKRRERNE